MRAAYTNGVLAALEDARVTPFDAVYGTSAGGALAAWWSAGQARYALDTWAYARDPRILSYRRWFLGRGPLLDHDALFRIVYAKEHPLDVAALERASHPVVVTVTVARTGEARYVDVRRGRILDWLRATGRLPFSAGDPVEIAGERYLDGGMADPVPVARALDDGADDVLLVLNSPPGRRKPEPERLARLVERRYPGLGRLVRAHHALHNAAVELAEQPPRGVRVSIIRPQTATGLRRLTRSEKRLWAAIAQGESDARAFLSARPEPSAGAAGEGAGRARRATRRTR
jgi:predicted patatin/cPLA2 family phospholipase